MKNIDSIRSQPAQRSEDVSLKFYDVTAKLKDEVFSLGDGKRCCFIGQGAFVHQF
jgi:hypothetical protein